MTSALGRGQWLVSHPSTRLAESQTETGLCGEDKHLTRKGAAIRGGGEESEENKY
jgi:hypothetical protein